MNVKHIHTNKDKAPRVRLNYIGYPRISLINHSWLITQSLIRSREREKERERKRERVKKVSLGDYNCTL